LHFVAVTAAGRHRLCGLRFGLRRTGNLARRGRAANRRHRLLGVTPHGTEVAKAATNHSPLFYIDEPAIAVATRALLTVAVDYLQGQ
jgi:hypothetical protein